MSHYVLYGLHTFEKYEDAVQMSISEKFNGIVVECTIPKGTRMFKGIFPVRAGFAAYAKYTQCGSYASEVLVVNKIMER
ncbi:hypothetical protein Xoosp13_399 [Xanthomonas phage Xoo-sp13]|nr:hypothetical protein Xoosp13_399 [Xanthomonas phage Xoo-sp13]